MPVYPGAFHKLHLPKPYRYSEDLDYVRRTAGPIGPYLDQLREVADDVGLSVSGVDRARQMVHMTLDAEATDPHGQIRIKIETNIAETTPFKTPNGIVCGVEMELEIAARIATVRTSWHYAFTPRRASPAM